MPRKTVCLILLLSISCLLSASALRAGLAASPSADWAESVLTSFLTLLPANDELEELNRTNAEKKEVRDAEMHIHSDLAAERETDYVPQEYQAYYLSDPAWEIVSLSVEEDFLLDETMLSYYSLRDELDLIFVFTASEEGALSYAAVHVWCGGRTETVFDVLYRTQDEEELPLQILSALAARFDPSLAVLDLTSYPSCRLFTQDDSEIPTASGYAFVPSDLDAVRLSAPGYEDLELSLDFSSGRSYSVDAEPAALETGEVTVTAYPWGSEASLFALPVASLPLTTSFQQSSVLMTLTSPGFAQESIQLTPQQSFYSVSLKPQWMAEDGRIESAKDEMYRSMRNTLLSFGLYVIMSSIQTIYPDQSAWTGIASGFAAGISVLNLADFIHDMLAYYNMAKQVYL